MSDLFNFMTEMSKQHANAGSYTFENPVCGHTCRCTTTEQCEFKTEPEPAPTVSLYNLLDQPVEYLDFLLDCAKKREEELRPMKLALNESYMKAVSWMNIIAGAIREKNETSNN